MQEPFSKRIANYINSNRLLDKDDAVIVGLSGGADSVALLSVLHSLGYRCVAAHCNFHLRGEESMRDECFCRRLCSRIGVEFLVKDFDVVSRRKVSGESVEMACRSLRYQWWDYMIAAYGCKAVAVGHHQEDNVETMMLNMLRGSGLNGMKGMLPKRGNIIRPMLETSRDDILKYLVDVGLEYVVDSTNLENDYKRNRIRNIIIPAIENVFPGAMKAMASSVDRLRDNYELYTDLVDRLGEKYIDNSGKIDVASIVKQERYPKMVLYELISRNGFNMTQVENIIDATDNDGAGMASGLMFNAHSMSYLLDRKVLIPVLDYKSDLDEPHYIVNFNEPPFRCRTLSYSEFCRLKHDGMMVNDKIYFDSEILTGDPVFLTRSWKRGDRIRPYGMKGSKLVSDLLSDAKLSVNDKRNVRILCRNTEILWVIGLRASSHFAVGPETSEVIELSYVDEKQE